MFSEIDFNLVCHNIHLRSQFNPSPIALYFKTTGVMITMNTAGMMKQTSGMIITEGALAAFLSASAKRVRRSSLPCVLNVSEIDAPISVPYDTTPTNDVKTDLKFTYGLHSDSASGTSWLNSLTDASLKSLATCLKSGKATGTMTVTKEDGTTDTVTCKDGSCHLSSGECITCTCNE